jgi:hypothetical protein
MIIILRLDDPVHTRHTDIAAAIVIQQFLGRIERSIHIESADSNT